MVDNFSLALSHGLIMLAALRLVFRPDLDDDEAPSARPGLRERWLRLGRGGRSGESA